MTNKKHHRIKFNKILVCAVVVIVTIVCGCMTANAATDGAVSEFVNEKIGVIRVMIIGEDGEIKEADTKLLEESESVDENGVKTSHYKFEAKNGEEIGTFEYEIKEDVEGCEWNISGNGIEGDVKIQTDSFVEPTTSENNQ